MALVSKMLPVDDASDVVLLERPNPNNPVVLGDTSLDASVLVGLFTLLPVELAFELSLLVEKGLDSSRPPFGAASETSRLEDVTFEPNGLTGVSLNILLLGREKKPVVDEDWEVPKIELFGGGWGFALLLEVAELERNRLSLGDSV